jgi:hypothetical protein
MHNCNNVIETDTLSVFCFIFEADKGEGYIKRINHHQCRLSRDIYGLVSILESHSRRASEMLVGRYKVLVSHLDAMARPTNSLTPQEFVTILEVLQRRFFDDGSLQLEWISDFPNSKRWVIRFRAYGSIANHFHEWSYRTFTERRSDPIVIQNMDELPAALEKLLGHR